MTIPMTLISLEIFIVDFWEPIFLHSITNYNLSQEFQTHIVPSQKCSEYCNNYFKPNNYPANNDYTR